MKRFDSAMFWDASDAIPFDGSKSDGTFASGVSHSFAKAFDPSAGAGKPLSPMSDFDQQPNVPAAAKRVYLPMYYEKNYQYPLVVWLHNDGFNENQVCQVMPHISDRNHLAVGIRAPQAMDESGQRFAWSLDQEGVATVSRQIDHVIAELAGQFNIHEDRVVLAGYQSGGSMAMQVALRNAGKYAAVISMGGRMDWPLAGVLEAGALEVAGQQVGCLQGKPFSILWQRAMLETGFDQPSILSDVQRVQSLGLPMEVRQYQDDDEMNTVALDDVNQWIMRHVVAGESIVSAETRCDASHDCWKSMQRTFSDN